MQLMTWIKVQADRVAAVALVVAGVVTLLVGWQQVSNALLTSEQIPYVISGGLFGLVLVGLGSVLWLSADLRDEWRTLKRIEEEVRATRLAAGAGGGVVETEVVVPGDPTPSRSGNHRVGSAAEPR